MICLYRFHHKILNCRENPCYLRRILKVAVNLFVQWTFGCWCRWCGGGGVYHIVSFFKPSSHIMDLVSQDPAISLSWCHNLMDNISIIQTPLDPQYKDPWIILQLHNVVVKLLQENHYKVEKGIKTSIISLITLKQTHNNTFKQLSYSNFQIETNVFHLSAELWPIWSYVYIILNNSIFLLLQLSLYF